MITKFLTASAAALWLTISCFGAPGQSKAAVQLDAKSAVHPGDTFTFLVKLNQPLPEGAHFDLRISPISGDEEIALGSGEPTDASRTVFKLQAKLPEGAIPGEWHIKVIWLFLPGAGWTSSTIAPNDLRFHVEGKPYPIPTTAEVTIQP